MRSSVNKVQVLVLKYAHIDRNDPVRGDLRPPREENVWLELETRIPHNDDHRGSGVTFFGGCGHTNLRTKKESVGPALSLRMRIPLLFAIWYQEVAVQMEAMLG